MNPRSGGPCQVVRNLTPHMVLRGLSTEVVCLDDPNSEYLSQETLPIHALGKGRGSWSYHTELRPWLNNNLPRFDAIFLHGLWQYPGYSLSRAIRDKNMPPYFVYPHGMLDPWFQHAPERRLKAFRNWVYWKLIEHEVVQQATAVLFTCEEEMRLACESFRPYKPTRQINVGNGVGTPPAYHPGMEAAFQLRCPGLKQRPFFLFLGRIDPKKGLDVLIKAYAAIERPGVNQGQPSFPCLVIAGPGLETSFGKKMQILASRICPAGSVLWPGMLTGDAKWGALYRAQAVVLSSHQENFGIAVVEALACGLPVLISKQINIWREIAEDHAGLVGHDTREGTEGLFRNWVQLSEEDKAAMKMAAKASYEKRYGIARVADNLLSTIQDLMAR